MEKTVSSLALARTKSDQLLEKVAAAFKSPTSSSEVNGGVVGESGSTTLSRKSSRQTLTAPSPGRGSGSGGRNTHIRKSRSAQLKLDLDDLGSGAALSRASSASLGLSFSFNGFTLPPDEIADFKPFSDEDIRKSFLIYVLLILKIFRRRRVHRHLLSCHVRVFVQLF